jgi:hypothetical protein
MDRTGDLHVKLNKPDSEGQMPQVFSHVWDLDLKRNGGKKKKKNRNRNGGAMEGTTGGKRGWDEENMIEAHYIQV